VVDLPTDSYVPAELSIQRLFWRENEHETSTVLRLGEPAVETAKLVRTPTATGGIIFRYFVGDGTHEQTIEGIRPQIQIRRGKDGLGNMKAN
jgi:hypothetical protein